MLLRLTSTLRASRVMRAIMRWSDGQLMVSTLWSSSRALALVFAFLLLGAFFFGSILFYSERLAEAHGGTSEFNAMSMSVWFMLVTFSTVGYGDVSPSSWTGRFVCVFAICYGVILMAMPITIVGNQFAMAWEAREVQRVVLAVQKGLVQRQMRAEDLISLFVGADVDKTGRVTFVEFCSFLRSLEVPMGGGDARRIFTLFDKDGNDEITYHEFCQVVFPELDASDWRDTDVARADAEQLANGKAFKNSKMGKTSVKGVGVGMSNPGTPSDIQLKQQSHMGDVGQLQAGEVAAVVPALKEQRAANGTVSDMDELTERLSEAVANKVAAKMAAKLTAIEERLQALEVGLCKA